MVKVVTPPASEPVNLAELQSYLRLDTNDAMETEFLGGLITAAREYCEGYQRRTYITQTIELALDEFPSGPVQLPRGNLQSVVSIKYMDAAGAEHTMEEGADYVSSSSDILGKVAPVTSWPSIALFPLDPIKIRYICGYGDTAAKVPLRIKQAIYMLVGYWYDNRSAVLIGDVSKEMEFSVKALLSLDRIAVI